VQIREFQEIIRRTYKERDSRRGMLKTFIWFVEEVGELADAMLKGDKDKIESEVADVAAWLFSVAELLGVDVEQAVKRRYGKGCPKCGSVPCECDFR